MGNGKIEIKRIENPTNRQVTYSKRRNGLFKKAQELTVLCDAKISLLIFSSKGKCNEYISPNTTTKKIYDQYQNTLGIDLWNTHYESMQEQWRKLKEINDKLRRETGQRKGGDLMSYLSFDELRRLEQNMAASLTTIRDRKVRNLEERYGDLLLKYEAKCEDTWFGLTADHGDYNSAVGFANEACNLYAPRLQAAGHPDLHHGGAF
ncbi:agamous-like MADS-box protein TM6 isoform X2 [Diospyros lotus]|uniref:agamous-like MADS-box protein TM6 isoform X2 n=1 Tax=Diospyros lotus TaxID=55363 RepID=UPI0022555F42|nr:agamous-like MADS-box protein TM6 isoform X2 [Diospyros lotus]